jgi:predicted enzyme related to lactoylglutathione lyase
MTHKHLITHIEFSTKDLEETKKFYSDVFEWEIKDYPDMDYTTFEAEGGTGGGFSPVSDESPAGSILVYINTPELDVTLQKISAAGGTILMDGYDIPGVGRMATFKDPTGNIVALLQPSLME